MPEHPFETLSLDALREELEKLRSPLSDEELESLVGMGMVPIGSLHEPYPVFALVQLVDALQLKGAQEMVRLKQRAVVFRDALQGSVSAVAGARTELAAALERHGVLGELAEMFSYTPVWKLESLRGEVRLEWRIRQAIDALEDAANTLGRSVSRPYRSGRLAGVAPEKEPAPAPDPYLREPGDRHPGHYSKSESGAAPRTESESGVRMPVLRGENAESMTSAFPHSVAPPTSTVDRAPGDLGAGDRETERPDRRTREATRPTFNVPHHARTTAAAAVPAEAYMAEMAMEDAREDAELRPTFAPARSATADVAALVDGGERDTARGGVKRATTTPHRAVPSSSEREPPLDSVELDNRATDAYEAAPWGGNSEFEAEHTHTLPKLLVQPNPREITLDPPVAHEPSFSGSVFPRPEQRGPGAAETLGGLLADAGVYEDDSAIEPLLEALEEVAPDIGPPPEPMRTPAPPISEPIRPVEPAGPSESALRRKAALRSGPRRRAPGPGSSKFARHTGELAKLEDLGATSSLGEHSVSLSPRRRTAHVDLDAVMRNPERTLRVHRERLEQDPGDAEAIDHLVALLRASEERIANLAWSSVRDVLASEAEWSRTYFGALVVMANRTHRRADRCALLVHAAELAAGPALREPQQAMELFAEAFALDPSLTDAIDAASEIAERKGWWPDLVTVLERRARKHASAEAAVVVARRAGHAARVHLNDDERCATLYEHLLGKGIYDEDFVTTLVDIYAREGRTADTLVLLLRCAELVEGPERVERLSRAADMCAEDMNDADRAMEIYESALESAPSEGLRERYLSLAKRADRRARALAFLAPRDGSASSAVAQADAARELFPDDPDLEVRALEAAYRAQERPSVHSGFALADCLRRSGHPTGEQDTLERMLDATDDLDDRLLVIRRLAPVYAAQPDGTERAIALYTDAVHSGAFDGKLVHALTSMLRAYERGPELLAVLFDAADRAPAREERVDYLRRAARAANELIDDHDEALAVLEEATDVSERDPEVLMQLADRCRRSGDLLAEMAALEQLAITWGDSAPVGAIVRLAELELTRPRGASRAADLLEPIVRHGDLPEDLAALKRIVPTVSKSASRPELELAFALRLSDRTADPMERLTHLRDAIGLQEKVGVAAEERVALAERAIDAAHDGDADGAILAEVYLVSARAKVAVGHWNAAVSDATRCVDYHLGRQAPGDTACVEAVELIVGVSTCVVDEVPLFEVLERAAATGVPALRVAYADACMAYERWQDAIEHLEPLAETGEAPIAERAAGSLEIARANVR